MSRINNLDWKTYESITKYIYETLGRESGVKIEGYGNSCKVCGKSGVTHQIDVLTSHSDGINTYRTAIECKFWKKKINKDIVMKLSETLSDTDVNKGIVVSKSGFTKDGKEYAKHKGIELIELREIEEKEDFKEINVGEAELQIRTVINRPEIQNIDIGSGRTLEIKSEFDFFNFIIRKENKEEVSFYELVNNFRAEINAQNRKFEIITKHYEISNGVILSTGTNEVFDINGITFSGRLIEINDNRNFVIDIVDKVWLIMRSIFNERTFTFSENGLIIENKK